VTDKINLQGLKQLPAMDAHINIKYANGLVAIASRKMYDLMYKLYELYLFVSELGNCDASFQGGIATAKTRLRVYRKFFPL